MALRTYSGFNFLNVLNRLMKLRLSELKQRENRRAMSTGRYATQHRRVLSAPHQGEKPTEILSTRPTCDCSQQREMQPFDVNRHLPLPVN